MSVALGSARQTTASIVRQASRTGQSASIARRRVVQAERQRLVGGVAADRAAYSSRLPGVGRRSRLPPRKHNSHPIQSAPAADATRQGTIPHVGPAEAATVERSANAASRHDGQTPQATDTASQRPTLDHATVVVPYAAEGGGVIDRDADLRRSVESILGQPSLVVTREIEMMNIFMGFEQANKYSILTPDGAQLGYLAEQETGALGGTLRRQLLRTHRAFEAHVLDPQGRSVLTIKRPTTLINSRVKVFVADPDGSGERLVGELHQVWHPYKRKYELFVNRPELDDDGQLQDSMVQFAGIDGGLWAWDFVMNDENSRPLGAISRNFRGLGRELFTDTGQYVLTFDPTDSPELRLEEPQSQSNRGGLSTTTGLELVRSGPARSLTMDERAVALATAVSADFDYFSRHSQTGSGSMFPFFWMGGGGAPAESDAPTSETGPGGQPPAPHGQDSSDVQAPPPAPGRDGGLGPAAGAGAGYDMLGGGAQTRDPAPASDGQPSEPGQQPWWGDTGSPASRGEGDIGSGQEDVWGNEEPWQDSDGSGTMGDAGGWSWTDFLPGGGDDG